MMHPVSAILLAAGTSTRMGQTKQLLPLGEKTAVRHCAEAIIGAGIGNILVVTGHDEEGVRNALRGLPLQFVRNSSPESDMAQSVRIGLRQVSGASTGVLICLADHPLVMPDTIRALLQKHREAPESIIVPCFQGRRGHPTLFPSMTIQGIFSVRSLRDIISGHPERLLPVDVPDEGVVLDMDTADDYHRILDRFKGQRAGFS